MLFVYILSNSFKSKHWMFPKWVKTAPKNSFLSKIFGFNGHFLNHSCLHTNQNFPHTEIQKRQGGRLWAFLFCLPIVINSDGGSSRQRTQWVWCVCVSMYMSPEICTTCEAEGTQWVKWLLSGYSKVKDKLGLLLYWYAVQGSKCKKMFSLFTQKILAIR